MLIEHYKTTCWFIYETFAVVFRNYICSLRFQVSESSSAVSDDLEEDGIRSACDGDEDLDGSGRDDPQSAR